MGSPDSSPQSNQSPQIQQRVEGNFNQVIGQNPGTAIGNVETLIQQAEPTREQARHQLPKDIVDFTGRTQELQQILDGVGTRERQATGLIALNISGMAGVGKSALAIHAAHQLCEAYGEFQLYVNLRGAEGFSSLDPSEVLSNWLRGLGFKEAANLSDLDQKSTWLRSALSDLRGLILLDNAADEDQVRPLLPSGAGCLVLITSRRRLVALEGVRFLELPTMPPAEAETLLRTLIEPQRQSVEAAEVTEIAMLCGRLPLALRIAGGTLNRSAWVRQPLSRYVQRLRDDRPLSPPPLQPRQNRHPKSHRECCRQIWRSRLDPSPNPLV